MGFESGQKQSVKLLQNMVYNTTPHPPSHTLSVNTVHLLWEGGGEVRESRGATELEFLDNEWGLGTGKE